MRSGESVRYEADALSSSGARVPVSVTLSAVMEGDRAVALVAAMRDESERRATEAALLAEQSRLAEATADLRTSASFLERIGDVAGVGGWELDLVAQKLTWSAQTRRIHEVPDDFVPDLDAAIRFYAPEARPLIAGAVECAIADGTPWDMELRLITATGRRIWARAQGMAEYADGRPVRLVGAFQDITAQVELRDALAASSEQLRVTLESIGDAVITTDAAGAVAWMNPAAEQLIGRERGETVWKPFADVVPFVDERTGRPLPNPVDPDSAPWPLRRGTGADRCDRHPCGGGAHDHTDPRCRRHAHRCRDGAARRCCAAPGPPGGRLPRHPRSAHRPRQPAGLRTSSRGRHRPGRNR
jgi:PAS domain-containing protein